MTEQERPWIIVRDRKGRKLAEGHRVVERGRWTDVEMELTGVTGGIVTSIDRVKSAKIHQIETWDGRPSNG